MRRRLNGRVQGARDDMRLDRDVGHGQGDSEGQVDHGSVRPEKAELGYVRDNGLWGQGMQEGL